MSSYFYPPLSLSPSLPLSLSPSLSQCLQELHSSDWYVPYHKLSFEGELGSGAFGTVKKARIAGIKGGASDKVVAVKMLKCKPILIQFSSIMSLVIYMHRLALRRRHA